MNANWVKRYSARIDLDRNLFDQIEEAHNGGPCAIGDALDAASDVQDPEVTRNVHCLGCSKLHLCECESCTP